MHGLKQAVVLTFDYLVKYLWKHGYIPISNTICIRHNKIKRTPFCLCVDDFGVKYYHKDNVFLLFNIPQESYAYTVYWTCQKLWFIHHAWLHPCHSSLFPTPPPTLVPTLAPWSHLHPIQIQRDTMRTGARHSSPA